MVWKKVNLVRSYSLFLWKAFQRWGRAMEEFDELEKLFVQMPSSKQTVQQLVAGVVGHYEAGITDVMASLEAGVEGVPAFSPAQLSAVGQALSALRWVSNSE